MLAKLLPAQITYTTVYADLDSARVYKNLKLIPIKTKGGGGGALVTGMGTENILSLRHAVEEGLVAISERGTTAVENVHWLRINNKSDKAVYISSGEVVMGGRQDRMVARDTVMVPTGKDQYIAVMCVEEDRWSNKEKKFAYSNYANPRLRKVLDSSGSQVRIWKEVLAQLDGSGTKAPTMAYLARRQDKKLVPQLNDYMEFFISKLKKVDTTTIGFVCVSGNRILGCDAFTGRHLFEDEMEPLLDGYVEEAITFGAPPQLENEVVKNYLDKFLTDEKKQEQYCKKNGKLFRYKKRVFHLTAYAE